MRRPFSALIGFLKKDDGPTAVEYAVMLSLILMACFFTIMALGIATSQR
jgi:pilus assembly protein Flp/PilA